MTDDKNVEAVRLIIDNAEPVAALEDPDPGLPVESGPGDDGAGGEGGRRPKSKGGLPEGCPVMPLGIEGEVYYYLDQLNQLRAIKGKEHSRLNVQSLFGAKLELLYQSWPRTREVTDQATGHARVVTTGWRPELAAEALMVACARRGVLDVPNRVRGPGAWLGEAGELVLHVGDGVAVSRPPAEEALPALGRLSYSGTGPRGRHFYPTGPAQPRPAEEPAAAGDDGPGGRLLALLGTWNWARGEVDAQLLLGWIGAAVLGGALKWRPLAWITGDRYTGKSTLHDLLRDVLGEALVSVSEATQAGIWQKLRHASLPVAIDELEAEEDNRRANQVIALARQAASGGVILRGGADHTSTEFLARSCFLFSSILIPPLKGQDRSRMAILELLELTSTTPPKLVAAELAALGAGLRRRLFDQWPRWQATFEAYRMQLAVHGGHSGRGADQFGTLLAAADLLIFDDPPDSEALTGWAEKLKAAGLAELADDAADHERCLEHLRSQVVDVYRNGMKQVLGQVVSEAAGRPVGGTLPDTAEANRVLALYGLKVTSETAGGSMGGGRRRAYLAVANTHSGLDGIFQGTHWAGRSGASGAWVQALRRVPEAERSSLRFGGASARCTLVPVEAVLGEAEDDAGP